MESWEAVLSPTVTTWESTHQLINKDILLEDKINQIKLNFINSRETLSSVNEVRPEIAQSWIRSKNYGLDLSLTYGKAMNKDTFNQLVNEKQLLLRAATPYIHKLKDLITNTDCSIILTDEQGVMLQVVCGNKRLSEKYHLEPGFISSEKMIGTSAHGICMLEKIPIQILGPEHYSQVFNQCSGSSAPIFDLFGNLVGTLSIGSDQGYHQNAHTLGMVISLAWAIENQFQIMLKNDLHHLTMESVDEGFITINKQGIIMDANDKARAILNYHHDTLSGRQYEDILGKQTLIKSVLETGKSIYDAEMQLEHKEKKLHFLSMQPIRDGLGKNYGCQLILKPSPKYLKTVSKHYDRNTKNEFDKIIGNSPEMQKSIKIAKEISFSDINILIQGETGTGKEVFANAIHYTSRPNGPFVAVNCAAIPRNLIESELFGYDGGAFTGADRSGRRGKIELANEGTLFLDEIGDMPLEVQPVLLRVLEEKKVMRLGSNKYTIVDFRLVAASNKNLMDLVNKNEFRQDLYYRLATFKVNLPSLRERGLDIINLAQYFISKTSTKLQMPVPILSEAVKSTLLSYNWPGNVRQLENVILCAVHLSKNGVITLENLPDDITSSSFTDCDCENDDKMTTIINKEFSPIKGLEKMAIAQALEQTGNQIRETAKVLGLSKSTLYRKIREYHLLDI